MHINVFAQQPGAVTQERLEELQKFVQPMCFCRKSSSAWRWGSLLQLYQQYIIHTFIHFLFHLRQLEKLLDGLTMTVGISQGNAGDGVNKRDE
jgi:hypothetical protein